MTFLKTYQNLIAGALAAIGALLGVLAVSDIFMFVGGLALIFAGYFVKHRLFDLTDALDQLQAPVPAANTSAPTATDNTDLPR
jgi:hypothetical protein